jgi:predicted nucleic-acid-binding protein
VRAIDTNILVRLCILDDEVQVTAAKTLLSEPFLVIPTVVLEAEWVLRSVYTLPPQRIANDLLAVLRHPNALTVSPAAMRAALDELSEKADFADALHAHLAAEAGATLFATFDRGVSRHVDVPGLTIETLT